MYRIIIAIMLAWSSPLAAETLPERLRGQWVLAEEATRQAASQHPEADASLARYLPVLLNRMRRAALVFGTDTIRFRQDGDEQVFPVVRQQRLEQGYLFHVTADQKSLTLTVSLHPQGLISMVSSGSDDLALYRWRRGDKPGPGSAGQDANALMQSQLNN